MAIEVTYNCFNAILPPSTAVFFDLLAANTAIERMKDTGLEVLDVTIREILK